MDNQKRKLTKNDEDATRERKVLTTEVKFKLNRNGVIDDIADMGMLMRCHSRDQIMQPGELSDTELININEE